MDMLAFWASTIDDCIQCAAEVVLAADPADVDEDLRKGLEKSHGYKIGQSIAGIRETVPQMADAMASALGDMGSAPIKPTDMERAMRTGRRMTRFTARIILLEPHECGKA